MAGPTRREFLELSGALGASLALGCQRRAPLGWALRPDYFPQGVASGDPDDGSVLL